MAHKRKRKPRKPKIVDGVAFRKHASSQCRKRGIMRCIARYVAKHGAVVQAGYVDTKGGRQLRYRKQLGSIVAVVQPGEEVTMLVTAWENT